MKFSIIVPIYKVESYLIDCLDSIMNQTYKSFECIMVDDGSPDNCGKICDAYAEKDDRFQVIHKINGGLVSARKAGATRAQGDYVINVDGDDMIASDFLYSLNRIIDKYRPSVVCFGATRFGGNDTGALVSELDEGYYQNDSLKRIIDSYLYSSQLEGINSGVLIYNVWAKCIERSIYVSTQNEIDNRIVSGEDTIFSLSLLTKIHSLYQYNYNGYFYRMTPQSIEHSFNDKVFANLNILAEEMFEISKKNNSVFDNRIAVYYAFRYLRYCLSAAQNSQAFGDYMKIIEKYNTKKEQDILLKCKIEKHNLQSRIKMYLLQNRRWRILYILARTWFNNRLPV